MTECFDKNELDGKELPLLYESKIINELNKNNIFNFGINFIFYP